MILYSVFIYWSIPDPPELVCVLIFVDLVLTCQKDYLEVRESFSTILLKSYLVILKKQTLWFYVC